MSRCTHCFKPIEQVNGYDYALRGPSWRHEGTRSIYCQTTVAEPMPEACPFCRAIGGHAPTCCSLADAAIRGLSQRPHGNEQASR